MDGFQLRAAGGTRYAVFQGAEAAGLRAERVWQEVGGIKEKTMQRKEKKGKDTAKECLRGEIPAPSKRRLGFFSTHCHRFPPTGKSAEFKVFPNNSVT